MLFLHLQDSTGLHQEFDHNPETTDAVVAEVIRMQAVAAGHAAAWAEQHAALENFSRFCGGQQQEGWLGPGWPEVAAPKVNTSSN